MQTSKGIVLSIVIGAPGGCSGARSPEPLPPAPIRVEINSLPTDFGTTIRVRGVASIERDSIVLQSDSVLLRGQAELAAGDPRVTLDSMRLGLATATSGDRWKPIAWGPAVKVGRDVSERQEFAVPGVRMTVPVESAGRLRGQWLVVELLHTFRPNAPFGPHATTYAHSARDVFRPR
jgi:hypothetical protein